MKAEAALAPQQTGAFVAVQQTSRLQAATASNVLYDAIGDNSLAPDLQQMLALTSDDGRYTVGITLNSNALIDGDFVASYVNTDGNALTGNPTFGGADLAVGILGQTGTDIVGTLTWNGSDWQPAYFPSLVSFTSGATDEVWSIAASDLGLAAGSPTTLYFGSMYSGVYYDYFDFAPEPGGAPLFFTLGALSPPPPVTPPPVTPPPVPAPTALTTTTPPVGVSTGATATVRPVGIRSFVLTHSGQGLKLRIGWVKGDGRVHWSVTLSARVGRRTLTKEVHGSGAAGTRSILRLVRLPATWRGAKVKALLMVDDNSHVLARTRSILN